MLTFLYIEDKKKCIGLQGILKNYNPKHLNRTMTELKNKDYKIIQLNMTTLQKLLNKYKLYNIDYLSLDVEGSELQVLKVIDFLKSNIKLIGVEINYNEDKNDIFKFLLDNNYTFITKQGDYFFERK